MDGESRDGAVDDEGLALDGVEGRREPADQRRAVDVQPREVGHGASPEEATKREFKTSQMPVMARKCSLFQSSEPFVALEEVLKWLEEVLNFPPNFSPFLLNT